MPLNEKPLEEPVPSDGGGGGGTSYPPAALVAIASCTPARTGILQVQASGTPPVAIDVFYGARRVASAGGTNEQDTVRLLLEQSDAGAPLADGQYRCVVSDGSGGQAECVTTVACYVVPDPDPEPEPEPEPGIPQLTLTQAPADWSPVHLPVLLTLSALPDQRGAAREVLCVVEASDNDGATWLACGAIRRTAGANKLVQFNLSEFLKSRFTIVAPQPGPDKHLALRWRVRCGFPPKFTGGPQGEELRLDTLHVVNGAAPNGGLGAYLSDLIPLPEGYAYRLSKISSSGVSNLTTTPVLEPAPCPPNPLRLIWLNQRGGWSSYVFAGKHEYATDVVAGPTWVDQDGAERNSGLASVTPTVNVYSDRLSPALAVLVRGVRRSVQVFELREAGQLIPVRVVPGSFPDGRAGEKSPTVDFTITYPRLAVQTQ